MLEEILYKMLLSLHLKFMKETVYHDFHAYQFAAIFLNSFFPSHPKRLNRWIMWVCLPIFWKFFKKRTLFSKWLVNLHHQCLSKLVCIVTLFFCTVSLCQSYWSHNLLELSVPIDLWALLFPWGCGNTCSP